MLLQSLQSESTYFKESSRQKLYLSVVPWKPLHRLLTSLKKLSLKSITHRTSCANQEGVREEGNQRSSMRG